MQEVIAVGIDSPRAPTANERARQRAPANHGPADREPRFGPRCGKTTNPDFDRNKRSPESPAGTHPRIAIADEAIVAGGRGLGEAITGATDGDGEGDGDCDGGMDEGAEDEAWRRVETFNGSMAMLRSQWQPMSARSEQLWCSV